MLTIRRRSRARSRTELWWGLAYAAPALGIVLVFIGYPFASIVYHAFTRWKGYGEPEVIDDNDGPGTVPRHQLTDDLKRLLTCIGRLEPDRQRMLLLAYYGAFSRDQLSTKLDMPVHLLRASLRRSLAEIEQCLGS